MKTLRISKTIFPTDKPKDFNEWAMYFWGLYGKEMERVKNLKSWDRNTYTIKK
ncbi:hypothetical protein UFOVP200_40 [uncultured Caudovirales phage]|uniref:Uncharacterized protein n=1 Tax=uncultured Caudovirales phage TaxID=2100421 RepID=A0A6J7WIQ8_9CAUD|nr:hypothetical protein UFOVP200_40 [uncultured Caudovirales phage]